MKIMIIATVFNEESTHVLCVWLVRNCLFLLFLHIISLVYVNPLAPILKPMSRDQGSVVPGKLLQPSVI
jgi:hypothetical protein